MSDLSVKKYIPDPTPVKRKYGEIKTSFLHYISPWMLGMIFGVGTLVTMNFATVKHNFETGHVALNGLILGIFLMGILQACHNNLKVYFAARFLNDIDDYMETGKITHEEYLALQKRLEKSASLINIKITADLLNNLYQYGNLLIRDKDAMMIKSKMGYRVKSDRGSVSFLTGILVMFGLIGTFWGLLETISSVATALNDIAASSSSETSASDMDMGSILGAISGPLKGMGLAFSASLFGLSGSLLLGFFSHLAGDAQNKNIEDISRWIDDRIPKPDQNMAEKGKDLKQVGLKENSDLEAWLASYAYLARRTDQNLASLFQSLTTLITEFDDLSGAIRKLDQVQTRTNALLESANQERTAMVGQYQQIIDNLAPLPTVMSNLEGIMKGTRDSMTKMVGHSETTSRYISNSLDNSSAALAKIALSSEENAKNEAKQLETNQLILSGLQNQQEVMLGLHSGLVKELKAISGDWKTEKTERDASKQTIEQSLEKQNHFTEINMRSAQRMESLLSSIQTSMEKTTAAFKDAGGDILGNQAILSRQIDTMIQSMIGPISDMREKIGSLEIAERVYVSSDEKDKKKRFKIFGNKD